MLQALEVRVNEIKHDISVSQEMLPTGAHTDLIINLKKVINDPLSQLTNMRNDIDLTVTSILSRIATQFFSDHKDVVDIVYKTENHHDDLLFCIVLKEDNTANRRKVFSFLRDYKCTNLSETFPIYFQFVSKEIENKLLKKEVILNNS